MSLSSELHRLIPDPCFDRPFVCDGPPESCDVMVIGENPATKMGTDWWSFWDDEKGFRPGQIRAGLRGGAIGCWQASNLQHPSPVEATTEPWVTMLGNQSVQERTIGRSRRWYLK